MSWTPVIVIPKSKEAKKEGFVPSDALHKKIVTPMLITGGSLSLIGALAGIKFRDSKPEYVFGWAVLGLFAGFLIGGAIGGNRSKDEYEKEYQAFLLKKKEEHKADATGKPTNGSPSIKHEVLHSPQMMGVVPNARIGAILTE